MKKDYCAKCGDYEWVEEHHILPKAAFGDNDETVWLCSNCHTDYHQQLGRKNLKNPDMEFHLLFHYRWLHGLLQILILMGIWYFLY